jgi:hypothetical protein
MTKAPVALVRALGGPDRPALIVYGCGCFALFFARPAN